jgi:hypothetical protein
MTRPFPAGIMGAGGASGARSIPDFEAFMQSRLFTPLAAALLAAGCTQETQNQIGRAVQNWTGTDGVLEVYAGDRLVRKFLEVDKMSTATSTMGTEARPYRYGYGVFDANLNGIKDPGEKRVYFEISDYSTPYVFFENPK